MLCGWCTGTCLSHLYAWNITYNWKKKKKVWILDLALIKKCVKQTCIKREVPVHTITRTLCVLAIYGNGITYLSFYICIFPTFAVNWECVSGYMTNPWAHFSGCRLLHGKTEGGEVVTVEEHQIIITREPCPSVLLSFNKNLPEILLVQKFTEVLLIMFGSIL